MGLKQWFRKSSPTILTCLGAGGVIGTAVLTAIATWKSKERIDEKKIETKEEAVKECWQEYVPAVLTGAATVACVFGSNALNRKQQAAILGAYTMLERGFQNYRESAKEVYGEDADEKIRAVAAKRRYIHADGYSLYDPEDDSSEKVQFYDSHSGQYFMSTLAAVIDAEYHLNRNFMLGWDCTVNDFCNFLGIPGPENGDHLYWDVDDIVEDGFYWIDFDNHLTELDDGMRCYVITSRIGPEEIIF